MVEECEKMGLESVVSLLLKGKVLYFILNWEFFTATSPVISLYPCSAWYHSGYLLPLTTRMAEQGVLFAAMKPTKAKKPLLIHNVFLGHACSEESFHHAYQSL